MDLSWDESKRSRTLAERGLDFADCAVVFAGPTYTFPDERSDYGEDRFITVGVLQETFVVVVHTSRDETTRIISMRKANERKKAKYERYFILYERSGK